jgi:hypothetical protein
VDYNDALIGILVEQTSSTVFRNWRIIMKPTDTVIFALNEFGLSEVIPELRYSNLFEVWFFYYREMQFGVDHDGIITLFSLTKF